MDFKISGIAKGSVVPHSVVARQMEEERREAEKKEQYRHDRRMVIFSAALGLLCGIASAVIATLITLKVNI